MQAPNQEPSRIYSYDPALHGSSQWATRAHLKSRNYGDKGRIFLGYGLPEPGCPHQMILTTNTLRHLLTVAPTRSGKLISATAPRCLEHMGSLVAIDVKNGELALVSARFRRDVLGQKVVLIDPWNVAAKLLGMDTARFNVLDWLDAESDDFVDDAMLVADSLIVAQGKDPFWDNEARALIMGLVQYVAATPLPLIPTDVKSRDLAQVRRLLNLPPERFKELLAGKFEQGQDGSSVLVAPGMAQSRNEHVRAASARILNKAPKEFSSVLSTAQQHTHFLESPRIQCATGTSDFDVNDLQFGKMSVYIILPAGRLSTYNRFLRMLLSIFITAATRFSIKPNPPVYFLVEEAPALGRLDVLETAFGLLAGYGIQLHLVIQDFNQLHALYGVRWQTFIGNSGVVQFFANRDPMTAEVVSRLCGMTTIENLSEETVARRAGLLSAPNYFSKQDSMHGRALITPDEVMTLHPAVQILILAGAHPVISVKTVHFMDRRYRRPNGQPIFDTHPHYQGAALPKSIDFLRQGEVAISALTGLLGGG